MSLNKLLVANRGEIAVRILLTARGRGLSTVAVSTPDTRDEAHADLADELIEVDVTGPKGFLDGDALVELALSHGCDSIHPGYGFLSESASFATAVEAAGLVFVGPTPTTLARLGSKVEARQLATELDIPIARGISAAGDIDAVAALLHTDGIDAVMLKAVAGGGGRGMRVVRSVDELVAAFERCRSEAEQAFGDGAIYAEQYMEGARHIEVQVVGDGQGGVAVIGDRDCSLQRRRQKIVEIAPAPQLGPALRRRLNEASHLLAESVNLRSLATLEFLVSGQEFVFCEANPRLQVEHTVTEETSGLDLVGIQLDIAGGASLEQVGLLPGSSLPVSSACAIQARLNAETMTAEGEPTPGGGTVGECRWPTGFGLRVDTALQQGQTVASAFDPLIAKIVATGRSTASVDSDAGLGAYRQALRHLQIALDSCRLEGLTTNQHFLQALLRRPEVADAAFSTEFVTVEAAGLVHVAAKIAEFENDSESGMQHQESGAGAGIAGARIDTSDPLAVLAHGKTPNQAASSSRPQNDERAVTAPLQGTVISISVEPAGHVAEGQELMIMEAMKMEHVVVAPSSGSIERVLVAVGDTIIEGHPLILLDPDDELSSQSAEELDVDLEWIRPDLAETVERHEIGLDTSRPDSVARRRKTEQRTARENIEDVCDDDSFVEYGALVVAAQRRRRSNEELRQKTPADGMVTGIGAINGDLFAADRAQCVVMSYDYTVLAGTQGLQNHRKKDRMFEIAAEASMPVVIFTEGGGGRPGDTDGLGVAGLDCLAFKFFAELSGKVPLIGINSGRCFAGNAALLGCCDVIIATANSNIGMGGPAMIEGGGLGIFTPEEVGPMSDQVPNGVVDLAVEDEEAAVAAAKQYLSYFQGPLDEWACEDQRRLRHVIPENRLRVYDVREVISLIADTDTVLELRPEFGIGMVTALARVEGRPVGIVANNPLHLGGAIDSDNADKAARFMQLCDAFGLPLVFLCDTPGIMVGPEVEKTALVRHAARLFVTSASLTVPFCTVVLRKGYGLGAQAMAGGSFHAPSFTVAWPTGEFGGMGLEGAVKLGYRNELAAIDDPVERQEAFDEMVDRMYEVGKGVNMASHFEIDDVIDPAATRRWIRSMLTVAPVSGTNESERRSMVDTW